MNDKPQIRRYFRNAAATSIILSAAMMLSSFSGLGAVTTAAENSGTSDTTEVSAAADYGLRDNIQEGTMLHCFDWKYNDIKDELPNIAQAGFSAVQTSPAQPGGGVDTNIWYWLYQPLGFYIGTNDLGTKAELKELCDEAEKYGVKVIIDVVANHLAGDHTYIDKELQDSKYWRSGGSWSGRKKAIYGDVGMPDIKSEDPFVQSKVKGYIQELKSVGVKGIRWDTTKHIQLESEDGCKFWEEVLDPDLYHYGEILGSPGASSDSENTRLMQEYTDLMSITDDVYSRNIFDGFNSGNVSDSSGYWSDKLSGASKLVYWGESHDTWSNNKGYGFTNEATQNVIDRTYAIVAARSDATALYFSRPECKYKDSILAGVKGSVHFASPEVAAVNHFHNAMVGQTDFYAKNKTDKVVAVCREKGAVVAALVGSSKTVSVSNVGSPTETGTYIDEITGNRWTVTSSTISGTLGGSGIAVLFREQDYTGSISADKPSGSAFNTDTMNIKLTAGTGITEASYSTSENRSGSFVNGTTITIGADTAVGEAVTVTLSGKNSKGNTITITYEYKKIAPEPIRIYFDNSDYNWSSICAYVYNNSGTSNIENKGWPGEQLTATDSNGYYYLELDSSFMGNGRVIFSDKNNASNRYPGNGVPGMEISSEKMLFRKVNDIVCWDKYEPDFSPAQGSVSAEADSTSFEGTLDVTLHAEDVTNPIYMTSEGAYGSFAEGDKITIGAASTAGSTIKVNVKAEKSDGMIVSQSYSYKKTAAGNVIFADPDSGVFSNTLTLTISSSQVTNGHFSTSEGASGTFENGDTLTIGQKTPPGNDVTVTLTGTKANGANVEEVYTYQKALKIYLDKTNMNWSDCLAYVYDSQGNAISGWPGEKMEKNSETGLYEYYVTGNYVQDGYLIFDEKKGSSNRYPASGQEGIAIGGVSKILKYDGSNYSCVDFYTKVEAVSPTCTKDGNVEYYNGADGKIYKLEDYAYTEITDDEIVLPSSGHKYNPPIWTWTQTGSGDYTASIKIACPVCGKIITQKADVTSSVSDGIITYTATAVADGVTYTSQKQKSIGYTVTVIGGRITNGEKQSYSYADRVTVQADAEKDGKLFSGWYINNALLTTKLSYTFFVTDNITITAKYEGTASNENDPQLSVSVSRTDISRGKQKISVTASWALPEGCTVKEAGIIRRYDNSDDLTLDKVDGRDIKKNMSTLKKPNGQFKYSFTVSSSAKTKTVYARTYVVYTDKNGNTQTAYSEAQSSSYTP